MNRSPYWPQPLSFLWSLFDCNLLLFCVSMWLYVCACVCAAVMTTSQTLWVRRLTVKLAAAMLGRINAQEKTSARPLTPGSLRPTSPGWVFFKTAVWLHYIGLQCWMCYFNNSREGMCCLFLRCIKASQRIFSSFGIWNKNPTQQQ